MTPSAIDFSLHLLWHRNVSPGNDELDATSKVAGQRRVHGHLRGHDDIFASRSAEVLMGFVFATFSSAKIIKVQSVLDLKLVKPKTNSDE